MSKSRDLANLISTGSILADGNIDITEVNIVDFTLSGNMDASDYFIIRPTLKDYAIEGSIVGNTDATETINMQTANFFAMTVNTDCTFTFSNPPQTGDFGGFVLELTNGGAHTLTWPGSVDWVGGTAPVLTSSGVDQLVFTTRDGGTTYFGFVAGLDIKSPA